MSLPEPIGEAALAFFQKLLGPVGEASEILSDKIRFYRWRSSLKTLKRAKEIAEKRGLPVNEVPLKFLIPFMEKASLEEEDSPLIEKWANLLASASSEASRGQTAFVEILSSLSGAEVGLLEKLLPGDVRQQIRDSWAEHVFTSLSDDALRSAFMIMINAKRQGFFRSVVNKTIEFEDHFEDDDFQQTLQLYFTLKIDANRPHILIESIGYMPDKDADNSSKGAFHQNKLVDENASSFDILVSKGLMNRFSYAAKTSSGTVAVSCVYITPLALAFVLACRGDDVPRDNSAK